MMPDIILGDKFIDNRGSLFYNNSFDATKVKRVYVIENLNSEVYRGWQGHKIEQRWLFAVQSTFIIRLIKIDNWESPSENLEIKEFQLNNSKLDVLHIPPGHVSCIRSMNDQSKLVVMSDYLVGELNDEYKYSLDYFNH